MGVAKILDVDGKPNLMGVLVGCCFGWMIPQAKILEENELPNMDLPNSPRNSFPQKFSYQTCPQCLTPAMKRGEFQVKAQSQT